MYTDRATMVNDVRVGVQLPQGKKFKVWSIGIRCAARFLYEGTDTYALAALIARTARVNKPV